MQKISQAQCDLPETDAKELTNASHVVAPGFKKFITTEEQNGNGERDFTNNNASPEFKATEAAHFEAAEQIMTKDWEEEVPKKRAAQLEEDRKLAAIRERAKASIEEARLRKLAMDSMHKVHTVSSLSIRPLDMFVYLE
jgi:hypothetical protein